MHLIVKAGYKQEAADQLELAHLLEHMPFMGTQHFENPYVFFESRGLKRGPDINAHTSNQSTSFDLELPSDDEELIDGGLQFLKDCAQGISLESKKIDTERKVVLRELYSKRSISQLMEDEYLKGLYKYQRDLGIDARISNLGDFKHEALVRYYRDWYRADLQGLVVVGNLDIEQMERQIQDTFSDLRNPSDRVEYQEHKSTQIDENAFIIVTHKEMRQLVFQIFNKHPYQAPKNSEGFKGLLMSRLFNEMVQSRLFELNTIYDSPVNEVHVSIKKTYLLDRVLSHLFTWVDVKPESIKDGVQSVLMELERIKRHGFTAVELEQAKADLLESIKVDTVWSSRQIADNIKDFFVYGIPALSANHHRYLVSKVLEELNVYDVNQRARAWISEVNRDIVVLAPDSMRPSLPTREIVLGWFNETMHADIAPLLQSEQKALMSEEEKSELLMTSYNEQDYIAGIKTTKLRLDNGITIYLKPFDKSTTGKMLIHGFRPVSKRRSNKNEQFASLAVSVITKSGLGNLNGLEVSKYLKNNEVAVSPYINEYFEGFYGHASSENFEILLQTIFLYFTHVRKDEQAFANAIRMLEDAQDVNKIKPSSLFRSEISKAVGIEEKKLSRKDLENIKSDNLLEIFNDHFSYGDGFTFVITGDFDTKEIGPLIQKYFGNIPSNGQKQKIRSTNKGFAWNVSLGRAFKKMYGGDESNATVSLNFHGRSSCTIKSCIKLELLATVLQNILVTRLRTIEGGTYSVSVLAKHHILNDERYSLFINFECDDRNYDNMISYVQEEIDILKSKGPSPASLRTAIEIQKKSLEASLSNETFWVSYLSKQLQSVEANLDDVLDWLPLLDKFTRDDVKMAARLYLKRKNAANFILLPGRN